MQNLNNSLKKSLTKERLAFLESLEKLRGYSDLTLKSYDASIQEALRFVEIHEEGGLLHINLMPYRMHIAELNKKTISKKLSAIRSFVNFLNEAGIRTQLKADESVKVAKTLPKPISHEKIVAALEHADEMERLVVTLLYTLGVRISELANLALKDIGKEWVRVLGKGNKQRDVPLLDTTRLLIEQYLSSHHPREFLFEKNSEKLSENSLRYIVTKLFLKVALKVTPHQLRHSYASSLLNNGAPIVDVSELLGHSSMATTQIYTKLGSALKKENYNKAHPLCKESSSC